MKSTINNYPKCLIDLECNKIWYSKFGQNTWHLTRGIEVVFEEILNANLFELQAKIYA